MLILVGIVLFYMARNSIKSKKSKRQYTKRKYRFNTKSHKSRTKTYKNKSKSQKSRNSQARTTIASSPSPSPVMLNSISEIDNSHAHDGHGEENINSSHKQDIMHTRMVQTMSKPSPLVVYSRDMIRILKRGIRISHPSCVICGKSVNQYDKTDALIPGKCFQRFGQEGHRICQHCWFEVFAVEDQSHDCPGCVTKTPLTEYNPKLKSKDDDNNNSDNEIFIVE